MRLRVPFRRQGVVRMHLHREFVLRIDVFDQQRKLQAEFLVNFVAYQIAHIDFDQLFEVVSGQYAVADDGYVAVEAGNFPTFADRTLPGQPFSEFFGQPPPPPDTLFRPRPEF